MDGPPRQARSQDGFRATVDPHIGRPSSRRLYRLTVMRKQPAALAVLAIVAVLVTASTAASQQSASLPDIEDEVMCPTCGVPLSHAFSPQAERQREFIRAQIERGRTKDQIKQALVAEFGPEVLAEPDPGERGFDTVAYAVPIVVVALGALAVWLAVTRARRRRGPRTEPAAELNQAESARLERDLSRYEL
jgi:cytochrome c-type biogenesis protein CcmH